MCFCIGLFSHGVVVKTNITSFTGKYLYSDEAPGMENELNSMARMSIAGIAAGISRCIMGIFHTIGHLFAALVTWKMGHLFHALKGSCEALRGIIEAIPLIGRVFAIGCGQGFPWSGNYHSWWMIKIYNTERPDNLDKHREYWAIFLRKFYLKTIETQDDLAIGQQLEPYTQNAANMVVPGTDTSQRVGMPRKQLLKVGSKMFVFDCAPGAIVGHLLVALREQTNKRQIMAGDGQIQDLSTSLSALGYLQA